MVVRPIDFVAVKGKVHAVLVHELIGEVGQVEPASLKAIELHTQALALYRERRFTEAGARFLAVNTALKDGASQKLAERCREFAAQPPPPSWNGSYAMAAK